MIMHNNDDDYKRAVAATGSKNNLKTVNNDINGFSAFDNLSPPLGHITHHPGRV